MKKQITCPRAFIADSTVNYYNKHVYSNLSSRAGSSHTCSSRILGGVIKFGFCRHSVNFLRKSDHIPLNWTDFLPNFEQNHPIFPKFSQIWATFGTNLGKFWKIDPHVGSTSPLNLLYWVPLPRPDWAIQGQSWNIWWVYIRTDI